MSSVRSFIKENWVRIVLNCIAWFIIMNATCNNSHNYVPQRSKEWQYIWCILGFNFLYFIAVYVNGLWLMPRLLFRKKALAYCGALLIHLALCSVIMSVYSQYLHTLFPNTPQQCFSAFTFGARGDFQSFVEYVLSVSIGILLLLFIFSTGLLAQKFFVVSRQKEAIQKQQMAAELSLLKSQINPHFLFNVLNSIYSLSLKKSDQAPEMVLKLSDLLRYMLYETKQELVPLAKEIGMVTDYIAIERMRIKPSQIINITQNGTSDAYEIAPVILIPFVENAVKHGLDSMINEAFVHIAIDIKAGKLSFHCSNNYKNGKQKSVGGIGLENVQKRLALLYPQKHSLTIQDKENIFTVTLSIDLNP